MGVLIIKSSDGEREVQLQDNNTIGRHPNNTIQLLDRIVSKEHSIIYKEGDKYIYKDLGSLNGTYINGNRISQVALEDGDEMTVGSTHLIYYEKTPRQSTATPKVTVFQKDSESFIRKKIAVKPDQFIPVDQITDNEQLKRDYERLRIAYDLQKSIGLEFDLDKLLNKILETSFQFLAADRGVIMLFDDQGKLVTRAVRTKKPINEEIIISNTIVNEVLKERAAILSSDAIMDSRFQGSKSIIMQGIRSSMAVPIIHKDQILGMMMLDSQVMTNAFDEKDLQILNNIANQTAILIENLNLARKVEDEAINREKLQRLLSPNLVEQVITGKLEVKKGGEIRPATVLFTDIRGFTALSERKKANEIVDMLNEYFELMVDILFAHEGTLDKFIGDAIMAIWGAPVYHPDDAIRAVRAAVDMQIVMKDFNKMRQMEGHEPIHIGVGINSGDLVAGYIGSSKTMEYSAIGDSVNVASRLCSIAPPDDIIISESTYNIVKEHFNIIELPETQVKGRREAIKIYSVIDHKEWDEVTDTKLVPTVPTIKK